jgi:hypothetical protein
MRIGEVRECGIRSAMQAWEGKSLIVLDKVELANEPLTKGKVSVFV